MENLKVLTGNIGGYKLLDSGEKQKLEEINGRRIIRSEPRAWWKKELKNDEWQGAVQELETVLDIGICGIKAKVKFKESSKHIGIFPEQIEQWRWVQDKLESYKTSDFAKATTDKQGASKKEMKILNLFGYTGIASLVAAKSGASVTHVDASKQSVDWARENQKLSGMENLPIYGEHSRTIRWIVDDVIKFIKKEVKRGKSSGKNGYDAIIMDPPSFGRGPKGEIWKIEEKLPSLLEACREVLSDNPLFIVFNMYSTELSSVSLANLLTDVTKNFRGKIECGELAIKPSYGDSVGRENYKILPMSIFASWSN